MEKKQEEEGKTVKETVKPPYSMKLETFDRKSISKLDLIEDERRMIRTGKVSKIAESLRKGNHFGAPFVINVVNSRQRLIDGNHRIEAMKIILKRNPDFSMKVWVAEYKDLNREEEREVYHIWSIGTSQSATDFIQAYFKTFPYGEEMLRKLPVTIYGDDTHLRLKPFIGNHINAKRRKMFEGGYGPGGPEAVKDFMEIKSEDINSLKEFYSIMAEVFGPYNRQNNYAFYGQTPFSVFHRIWYDNQEIPKVKFVAAFKETFAKNMAGWQNQINAGGRGASKNFYVQAIYAINRYHKSLHFLSDKEVIEIEKDNEHKEVFQMPLRKKGTEADIKKANFSKLVQDIMKDKSLPRKEAIALAKKFAPS